MIRCRSTFPRKETRHASGFLLGVVPQGTGALTWVWDGNEQVDTGRLEDGEQTGHWVLRNANGTVVEGPYFAGKQTGHWVIREPDGDVGEGPMVDGRPHGPWVYRWRSGDVSDLEFVNGEVVSSRFR